MFQNELHLHACLSFKTDFYISSHNTIALLTQNDTFKKQKEMKNKERPTKILESFHPAYLMSINIHLTTDETVKICAFMLHREASQGPKEEENKSVSKKKRNKL